MANSFSDSRADPQFSPSALHVRVGIWSQVGASALSPPGPEEACRLENQRSAEVAIQVTPMNLYHLLPIGREAVDSQAVVGSIDDL